MNKKIRALLQKKAVAVTRMRALADAAADRDMSAEESAEYDALRAEAQSLNVSIERETELAAAEAQIAAIPGHAANASTLDVLPTSRVEVVDNRASDPRRGFQSFGEFAQSVRAAGLRGGIDDRLAIDAAAPSVFGSESVGSDGGFLVPPQWSQDIFTLSLEEQALLPMTDSTPISGNAMVFPKDETTPWGTDGVRAYWQQEATSATATKPKLGVSAYRLHKLMALVPITDELLADTNALGAYLPGKMATSIRWKTDEAILFGTGAGQPIGALASKAMLVVSKDTGQATKTLSVTNLSNMLSQLPTGSASRAFWMINPDVIALLPSLVVGNVPVYLPISAGVQNSPYGTLFGRPIVVSEHAGALSTQGDVSLMDLSYYRSITSRGGIQTSSSMHLYFDADATAFRTTFRVDGGPKIENPITPPKSTNKRSPFLVLQAR